MVLVYAGTRHVSPSNSNRLHTTTGQARTSMRHQPPCSIRVWRLLEYQNLYASMWEPLYHLDSRHREGRRTHHTLVGLWTCCFAPSLELCWTHAILNVCLLPQNHTVRLIRQASALLIHLSSWRDFLYSSFLHVCTAMIEKQKRLFCISILFFLSYQTSYILCSYSTLSLNIPSLLDLVWIDSISHCIHDLPPYSKHIHLHHHV